MHLRNKIIVLVLLSLALKNCQVSSVPIPGSEKVEPSINSEVIAGGAQIQNLNNGIQQIQLPVSEYSDWHNESRQRKPNESEMQTIKLSNNTLTISMENSTTKNTIDTIYGRDKKNRIDYIQQYVLMTLGKNNRAPPAFPPSSIPVLNRVNGTGGSIGTTIASTGQTFTGESHTFSGSCDLPEGVDSEVWKEEDMFRIYFNTSSIDKNSQIGNDVDSRAKMSLNLLSSKLMLYKHGRGLNPEPANYDIPQTTELCNNSLTARNQQFRSGGSEMPLFLSDSEDKIFVRLYWYTAPVTKHHYKKKLLDTKTVLVKESGWIVFDIQKAVKTWIEKSLNYGLVIEVENEDNDLVNAGFYFSNQECNGDSNALTAPRLDLCTLSLPIEASGIKRPVSFPISSFLPSGRRSPSTDESLEEGGPRTTTVLPINHHRHRHHHGDSYRSARKHRVTKTEDNNNSMMQGDSPYEEPATATEFSLTDDHPLKQIFATAKTYLSREELYNRRRRKQHRRFHDFLQRESEISTEESKNDNEDSLSNLTEFEPIFVENQNIYIGSSSSNNNRKSSSSSSSNFQTLR